METNERNCVATVKESAEGKPWVLIETYEDIGLKNKSIALDFGSGTNYEQAQEVARLLNRQVRAFRLSG